MPLTIEITDSSAFTRVSIKRVGSSKSLYQSKAAYESEYRWDVNLDHPFSSLVTNDHGLARLRKISSSLFTSIS